MSADELKLLFTFYQSTRRYSLVENVSRMSYIIPGLNILTDCTIACLCQSLGVLAVSTPAASYCSPFKSQIAYYRRISFHLKFPPDVYRFVGEYLLVKVRTIHEDAPTLSYAAFL